MKKIIFSLLLSCASVCLYAQGKLLNSTALEQEMYYSSLEEALKEPLKVYKLRLHNLTSLPKEIGELKNLQYLNLEINSLTSLPKEIGELKNLQVLNLHYNSLTSLPKEIGNLKDLEGLYLSIGNLTSLPREIKNLKKLQNLNLGGNPISDAEQENIKKLLPNCKITF